MAAPIAEPNASAIPCGNGCCAACGIDVGVALPYMRLNMAMTSTSGGGASGLPPAFALAASRACSRSAAPPRLMIVGRCAAGTTLSLARCWFNSP